LNTKAEFNWDGEGEPKATRTSAKTECIVNFTPAGIDWTARGVTWKYSYSGGGSKFDARLQRLRIATVLGQAAEGANRVVAYNDANWVSDGDSDQGVAQYPTTAKPNKAFRIDRPYFDADACKQMGFRLDFREIVEWHNGTTWCIITSETNATWHANMTSVLPNGTKGGTNNHGAGATAENVPNTQPVANAGDDQNVASQAFVTLDGSGSSDADNDTLTYKWTQTDGPAVTLSDDTAQKPTFNAPAGPTSLTFQLKVSDICKDLHHHQPDNYESEADAVTINVAAP